MPRLYHLITALLALTANCAKQDDRFVIKHPLHDGTFKHWKATGQAVFLTKKTVLSPELTNSDGLLYAKHVSTTFLSLIFRLDLQSTRFRDRG